MNMDAATVTNMTCDVERLLDRHLNVRGRSLDHALRKAGRRLPAALRRDGQVLVEASKRAGHPKLRHHVDAAEVARAHAALTAHLRGIDPGDLRKGRGLDILGTLLFNLIVLFSLLVAFLVWRGLV